MPRSALTIIIILFGMNIAFAQQPLPKKYTNAELRSLGSRYHDMQKQLSVMLKERKELEETLRAYDAKLRALGETMQKTEEQIDFACGTYSYDANFSAISQQVHAVEMAYNLKTIDLLSEIQREQTEFTRAGQAMGVKYDYMKNLKSSGR